MLTMRHSPDKWILMKCELNIEQKKITVYKGKYIIKSLEETEITKYEDLEIMVKS